MELHTKIIYRYLKGAGDTLLFKPRDGHLSILSMSQDHAALTILDTKIPYSKTHAIDTLDILGFIKLIKDISFSIDFNEEKFTIKTTNLEMSAPKLSYIKDINPDKLFIEHINTISLTAEDVKNILAIATLGDETTVEAKSPHTLSFKFQGRQKVVWSKTTEEPLSDATLLLSSTHLAAALKQMPDGATLSFSPEKPAHLHHDSGQYSIHTFIAPRIEDEGP